MTGRRPGLARALSEVLGEPAKVSDGASILDHHSRDHSSGVAPQLPDAVAFPESTEDVSRIVAFAAEHAIPVVPFGAGTSNGGKIIPVHGGISLDLTRMNRILALHADDLDVVVEPGVLRVALNAHLTQQGLFFPVDPGADASLGGMAATNASGTMTFRYGAMRPNILALEVVLADGSIVRTGTRARKSTAGYDMTGLIVGAEGTLGVITELTLRVRAVPERTVSARVAFTDLDAAAAAVVRLSALGAAVSRLELLDAPTLGIFNAHFGTSLPESPTLFIQYDGSEPAIEDDLTLTRELADEFGSVDLTVERDPTAQHRLWNARHNFAHAMVARHPGKASAGTDVCVPISKLPEAIAHGRRLIAERGLEACLLGHAGDGNYHFYFMVDRTREADVAMVEDIHHEMVEHALACDGTSAAEQGIGSSRIGFLRREHGDLIPAMRQIKLALDPQGILNPGKILPDPA